MLRRAMFTLVLLGAASCYSPQLSNFGFACDTSAPKPCPDGYYCNNGFCDDGSGGHPPATPGTGGNGSDEDMAVGGGGGGGGGGTGGSCQQTGGSCMTGFDCCSHNCEWDICS